MVACRRRNFKIFSSGKRSKELIKSADLIFTLDFNNLSRIEDLAPFIENSEAVKL